MFTLRHNHKVIIENLPLQWMTRIELFSLDLEQFPLMYVHFLTTLEEDLQSIGNYNLEGKQRIFGFALSVKWGELKNNGLCDVEIDFVCNIPQNYHENFDNMIKEELKHRIGISDKVSREDLDIICSNSLDTLPLLQKIWDEKIEVVYGKYIPHGKIFDEVYGIIRFSASGNAPKLGKVSEYRMLYWYMKDIGEKVELVDNVNHFNFMEFYILPTYEELRNMNFQNFQNFQNFFNSTNEFWEHEYTNDFSIGNNTFKSAPREHLPNDAATFEERYPTVLDDNDYDNISTLRQIFNRMPGRLYGYIWNIMTPTTVDFYSAFEQRDAFKEFYRDYAKEKGFSAKVIACFLQQSFGIEAFPIDTWVKTFIYYPLGLSPKNNGKSEPNATIQNNLYDNFNRLDKLEKLIWVSSMGNKTNKTEFLDILWCQRYGTDRGDKGPCRGANPLSCLNCILREECISYQSISNEIICVADNLNELDEVMQNNNLFFGILTEHETPRKVYTTKRDSIEERDSHSGLNIPSNTIVENGQYTLSDFINGLV